MCCGVLGGDPRFETTCPLFTGYDSKLTHSSSPVSSCSCYRLHSTRHRGGHLRLWWKEYCGWRVHVTGGETQQLLQTNFSPARLCYQARRGPLNPSMSDSSIPVRVLYTMAVHSTPCATNLFVDNYKHGPAATQDQLKARSRKTSEKQAEGSVGDWIILTPG